MFETDFGDDEDDLSGLTDTASSASDTVTGAAQDASSAVQGAVSGLTSAAQGVASSGGSLVSSALQAIQAGAPAVAAASTLAGATAKITGNQTLGQVASLGQNLGPQAAKALSKVGISGPDADIITGAAAAVAANAASASIPALPNVWDQAESDAVNTGKDVVKIVAASEAVIGAAAIVLSAVGFTALATILSTLITQIITILTLGIVTATATGAALGAEAGAIGVVVGAVIGACVGVVNFITGGPKVTITNGRTYSAEDYVKNNLQNAANWVKKAQPGDFIGLTVKCFADTFDLFLANPIWLYENQTQTGLPQPMPPDYNSGSALDQVYQTVPGAFEMLNQIQLVLATSIVHSSPGRLPFFMQVTHAKGAVANKIDQNPANYQPIPPPSVAPGSITTIQAMLAANQANLAAHHLNTAVNKKRVAPPWAPGSDHSSGGVVYTGALNMLTNDCVITPAGKGIADAGAKITNQTNIPDGAFMLQIMLPAVTTDQCHQLFTSAKPAYDAVIAKVDAWLTTQKVEPKPDDFKQFNITTEDVATAISLWRTKNPPAAAKPRVPISHTVGAHLQAKAASAKAIAAAHNSKSSSQPAVVNGGTLRTAAKKIPLAAKVVLGGASLAGLGMLLFKRPQNGGKF